MHKTLEKQVKKFLGKKTGKFPEFSSLLDAVSVTYKNFDDDRLMMQRSLDLSTKELTEINEKLKREIENATRRSDELERINRIMIGRELKMVELKKEIEKLKKELGQ